MPLLGYTKKEIITEGFRNAFITVGNNLEEEGFIYLIYSSPKTIFKSGSSISHFKYKECDVYKIQISKQKLKKFIAGEYSTFTSKDKYKILSFWGLLKGSRLHSILHPTTMLYENYSVSKNIKHRFEIWPKPTIISESFS